MLVWCDNCLIFIYCGIVWYINDGVYNLFIQTTNLFIQITSLVDNNEN